MFCTCTHVCFAIYGTMLLLSATSLNLPNKTNPNVTSYLRYPHTDSCLPMHTIYSCQHTHYDYQSSTWIRSSDAVVVELPLRVLRRTAAARHTIDRVTLRATLLRIAGEHRPAHEEHTGARSLVRAKFLSSCSQQRGSCMPRSRGDDTHRLTAGTAPLSKWSTRGSSRHCGLGRGCPGRCGPVRV